MLIDYFFWIPKTRFWVFISLYLGFCVGIFSQYFFILFRYLDLYEAIEEGSTDALDNTDLIETDIPLEVPLPEVPHLPRESHEAVKEWVLAVSMDQKVEQRLPVDERMAYEASLITANTGTAYQPCIITGNYWMMF